MEKMRKNFTISMSTYSANVGHAELELELEISRIRHRAKALRNEGAGMEEEADIRQRQLPVKK